MIVWGISAGGHDAALSVLRDNEITWASHSERFSRIKNHDQLDPAMIAEARSFGEPDLLVWHENTWTRKLRELRSGQWGELFAPGPKAQMKALGLGHVPLRSVSHHHSHAAAAFYTSGFKSAAVLVVDAVGENETLTVWQGHGDSLVKVKSVGYPNSLGLFYTAMTERCGFKPNEEEYIMMGLAASGNPNRHLHDMQADLIEITDTFPFFRCRFNHHRGFPNWRPDIVNTADLAAAAQQIFTTVMLKLSKWMNTFVSKRNLVISGGCALNCVTNSAIAKQWRWRNIWIMPNPGDAGNSLGAALAHHGKMVEWTGPYLGHDIQGDYPVDKTLNELLKGNIVGVANGRAEFGPRALGNRSLFGDPRLPDIRDRMNVTKQRESFRPFAPVILAEYAKFHFDDVLSDTSYMQYTVYCNSRSKFPGIVHRDGTSRLQTVNRYQNPGLYKLLTKWHTATGCPMLVNTSLNIKGQPMVNDEADAAAFESAYGIPVFCKA